MKWISSDRVFLFVRICLPTRVLLYILNRKHDIEYILLFEELKCVSWKLKKMDWDFSSVEIIDNVLSTFSLCYCTLSAKPPFKLMNYVCSNCILYKDTIAHNVPVSLYLILASL
jgi:hypothetical protein